MYDYYNNKAKTKLIDSIDQLKYELKVLTSITVETKKDGTEYKNLAKNFKVNVEGGKVRLEDDFLKFFCFNNKYGIDTIVFDTYQTDTKLMMMIINDRIEQRQQLLAFEEQALINWDTHLEQLKTEYAKFVEIIKSIGASDYLTSMMLEFHSHKLI